MSQHIKAVRIVRGAFTAKEYPLISSIHNHAVLISSRLAAPPNNKVELDKETWWIFSRNHKDYIRYKVPYTAVDAAPFYRLGIFVDDPDYDIAQDPVFTELQSFLRYVAHIKHMDIAEHSRIYRDSLNRLKELSDINRTQTDMLDEIDTFLPSVGSGPKTERQQITVQERTQHLQELVDCLSAMDDAV